MDLTFLFPASVDFFIKSDVFSVCSEEKI